MKPTFLKPEIPRATSRMIFFEFASACAAKLGAQLGTHIAQLGCTGGRPSWATCIQARPICNNHRETCCQPVHPRVAMCIQAEQCASKLRNVHPSWATCIQAGQHASKLCPRRPDQFAICFPAVVANWPAMDGWRGRRQGTWCNEHGPRLMVSGTWSMVHGPWNVAYGVRAYRYIIHTYMHTCIHTYIHIYIYIYIYVFITFIYTYIYAHDYYIYISKHQPPAPAPIKCATKNSAGLVGGHM